MSTIIRNDRQGRTLNSHALPTSFQECVRFYFLRSKRARTKRTMSLRRRQSQVGTYSIHVYVSISFFFKKKLVNCSERKRRGGSLEL